MTRERWQEGKDLGKMTQLSELSKVVVVSAIALEILLSESRFSTWFFDRDTRISSRALCNEICHEMCRCAPRPKTPENQIGARMAMGCKILSSRSPEKVRENYQNFPGRAIIIKKSEINLDRHSIGFYILTIGAIDEGIDFSKLLKH